MVLEINHDFFGLPGVDVVVTASCLQSLDLFSVRCLIVVADHSYNNHVVIELDEGVGTTPGLTRQSLV